MNANCDQKIQYPTISGICFLKDRRTKVEIKIIAKKNASLKMSSFKKGANFLRIQKT